MKKTFPLAILTAGLLFSISPAYALFGDDQAQRDIAKMREEYNARLESLEAVSRGQLEFANQMEALKSELASLRGQIEVLSYELQQLQQRQRDFYVDLDQRLQRLEPPGSGGTDPLSAIAGGGATATGGGAQGGNPDPYASGASGADAQEYQAAVNLLIDGKNTEALAAFEKFITHNLTSPLLPSANFWAGNAAMQSKEVATARNYFSTVITNWPSSDVAPDAMLGLASSQELLGEARLAKETLNQLLSQYPDSSAAKVASQRLKKTTP